mgnify:FL=1
MTADIRTAAQREANRIRVAHNGREYGMAKLYKDAFVDGAVWGAERVTPTREAIAAVMNDHTYFRWGGCLCGVDYESRAVGPGAHAEHLTGEVAALLGGLAEGEKA